MTLFLHLGHHILFSIFTALYHSYHAGRIAEASCRSKIEVGHHMVMMIYYHGHLDVRSMEDVLEVLEEEQKLKLSLDQEKANKVGSSRWMNWPQSHKKTQKKFRRVMKRSR